MGKSVVCDSVLVYHDYLLALCLATHSKCHEIFIRLHSYEKQRVNDARSNIVEYTEFHHVRIKSLWNHVSLIKIHIHICIIPEVGEQFNAY